MASRWIVCGLLVMLSAAFSSPAHGDDLKAGGAAIAIPADDSMDMAGGIHAWKAQGEEAPIRASALCTALGDQRLLIISCDVLFVQRDFVDKAIMAIAEKTGIPASHILVHATHTHSAPSVTRVHGYQRDDRFVAGLERTIVEAGLKAAAEAEKSPPARLLFRLGEESSVGQNSRLLLADGTIFWTGSRDDVVRPTGPFDPELPVLRFVGPSDQPIALLFNHSTHTIGGRIPMKRSPAFYGLAAQELEAKNGGVHLFLQGASGSTHNLNLLADEMVIRIKNAVERASAHAEPMPVESIAAIKEPFAFKVRMFDESAEEEAVTRYCNARYQNPADAESVALVFRTQRAELAPHRGEVRTTWVQSVRIGEVAFVGIPAEFFTVLGEEIKRQSPFRYTYVAELSNDWIGYVPDREGFALGGYQVWTGHHSYCEPGTGERLVETAVDQLKRLAQ